MLIIDQNKYNLLLEIKNGRPLQEEYNQLKLWLKLNYNIDIFHAEIDKFYGRKRPRLNIYIENNNIFNELKIFDEYGHFKSFKYTSEIITMLHDFILKKVDKNLYCMFFNLKEEIREFIFIKYSELMYKHKKTFNIHFMHASYPNLYIFYENENDIKINEKNGNNHLLKKEWNNILYLHDDFEYMKEIDWKVNFDNYQNVRKKTGGSYFYYFR